LVNPDENGEGEVAIFGRHVMMGYLDDEEETRRVFDEDGYYLTGDTGKILDGKFVKITGRIKELIIGAGGENVAPVPIEDAFKNECPACSNIVVVGEQRRFISAIITLKVDIDMKTGTPTQKLLPETVKYFKKEAGVTVKTAEEACNN